MSGYSGPGTPPTTTGDEDLPDVVRTPAGWGDADIRVDRSRFLAVARPARIAQAGVIEQRAVRRRHLGATRHVWALRMLDGTTLWDHDGEPSGTAGRRVLEALRSAELLQAAAVVTRWRGGTELGTERRGRAYREAARLAIEDAGIGVARTARVLSVRYEPDDFGAVRRVGERVGARLQGTGFQETDEGPGESVIELVVPLQDVEATVGALRDATGGRADVEVTPRISLVEM